MVTFRWMFIVIVSFTSGFIIHAFMFPSLLIQNHIDIQKGEVKSTFSSPPFAGKNDAFTYVDYEQGNFHPSKVTMNRGNHIAITNKHIKTLMWLSSETPFLSTKRGYGLGERLEIPIATSGVYTVVDRLNPQAKLHITVQ